MTNRLHAAGLGYDPGVVALLQYAAYLAIACAAAWRPGESLAHRLGLRAFGESALVRMAVVIVVGFLGITFIQAFQYALNSVNGVTPHSPLETVQRARSVIPPFIVLVVVGSCVEEITFRGFLFGGLVQRLGGVWAALVSSGVFALSHVTPVLFPRTFFYGLLLCWLYRKSGSIIPGMILHFLGNAMAFGAASLVST